MNKDLPYIFERKFKNFIFPWKKRTKLPIFGEMCFIIWDALN